MITTDKTVYIDKDLSNLAEELHAFGVEDGLRNRFFAIDEENYLRGWHTGKSCLDYAKMHKRNSSLELQTLYAMHFYNVFIKPVL